MLRPSGFAWRAIVRFPVGFCCFTASHFFSASAANFRRRSSTVEHLFCKQAVAGSNPIAGSMLRAAKRALRSPAKRGENSRQLSQN